MRNTSLMSDLWEYAEERDTEKKRKLYDFLNRDKINDIVLDNDVFWLEYNIDTNIPNYIYNTIVNHFEKQGYRYLYNIPTNI